MRRVLFKHKRNLGQHFIVSDEVIKKMIIISGTLEHFNIIEIGPGYGALTREILKHNPKSLLAVEKDSSFIKFHSHLLNTYKSKYRIIEADALYLAEETLISPPIKLIANLPYNISVMLCIKWLHKIKYFTSLILILQQEVVERLVAQPNSRYYGFLSIISQLLCNIKKEFDILPTDFYPIPKVHSAAITLNVLPIQRYEVNLDSLIKITNIIFTQRRKMIRKILQGITNHVNVVLDNTQLSGLERPASLTIEQLCILTNNLSSMI
ncbi:16S rRNA (adenine(1518)-N(6)/adenine(1519)-N(6))-dimethyltransferase RsmA [Wolbachia endosymbiont of Howardula sp.]|uniref:16S rRNA (adenine(1518)-N(6)/adenine(1519)-N(6))- dimethyltransferase RsmA n=1 Tax=Wolbachia endosymbiont of Howardula sp. TaxID=2916816 RepID=UPI00217E5978|nr:16S rRNA (adenine(1518)-N(6)/adenine(1519)-N(6))-dimethyltransferase RsmA [Wolbachia endosymbiont of Howardula sp.]UWI83235.1 16S rRNA (adenine(1518)-N(6)/adenine(1519)-N(6))-dimethyltransferase RsmA [Wolbachia endosymbiont of Howardula sp.]